MVESALGRPIYQIKAQKLRILIKLVMYFYVHSQIWYWSFNLHTHIATKFR